MSSEKVTVVEDSFGSVPQGQPVRRFTLTNTASLVQVQVINYGATITSIKVPDRKGQLDDIVLGFDTIEGYLNKEKNPYFGATIGRVCNRIGKGKFVLNGVEYQLGVNNGPNHLHGGFQGFDKKMWDAHVQDGKVVMSYISPNGEEGYPGTVLVNVTFELTFENELKIHFTATTTKPTPIALTNHSYFNLSGHKHGDKGLASHHILMNAESFTPLDSNMVTYGEILPVAGTVYDFLHPGKALHEMLKKNFPAEGPHGYDNNFCVRKNSGGNSLVAIVQENKAGRLMEVHSNQPGVQFYTANFFPEKGKKEPIVGKSSAEYWKHGGFCLETQNYPNAVNHKNFPSAILNPGEVYQHELKYKFVTLV